MMVQDPVQIEDTGLSQECFARCQRAISDSGRARILWEYYFKSLEGAYPNPSELQKLVDLICSIAGV